ncbi:hypothetical protein M0804_015262 [Polistes exclamans]|nr:hypothetical protein M0804_015262 [Polistes exclamans]
MRKGPKRDCVVCSTRKQRDGRRQTSEYCDICPSKLRIHMGDCFQRYHSMKLYPKMQKRPKLTKILENINIRENFSDIDQGDFDPEIKPADISKDQSEDEVCISSDSNSEEENILNVRKSRRLLRLSSSSNENDR